MSVKFPRERLRAGLAIVVLVCAVVALFQTNHWLQRFEWITYDYRLHFWHADKPLHPDVAVVLIDESSLAAMDPIVGRFPWPRSVYAPLIDYFQMGGAKAVVFDIMFAERQHNGAGAGSEDATLVDAVRASGNVYQAAEFRYDLPDEGQREAIALALPQKFRARFALSRASGFSDGHFNAYTLPLTGLLEASRGVGGVTIEADSDGVFRRSHLFFTYLGAVIPAQGVAPILDRLGTPIERGDNAIRFGAMEVPLDTQGQYLVGLAGNVEPYSIGGIFKSILKIRNGELENLPVDPYEFKDKVVFIGANAVGLQDLKTTALSTKTPGVYIHASIMSNLLQRDFLRPVASTTTAFIVAMLVLLTVFVVLATSRLWTQFALPTLLAVAYGLAAMGAFRSGWVLDMAAPFAGIALGLLSTFGFLVFTEGRDKRRVRAMFSQYVSPAVLEEVVDQFKDQLRAEIGTREHLSILFSDVRGFTSISEKLEAEQVVDLLNIHFSVMGEIIFRHKGTLDKFIGDAIMAFWGAPIPVTDHARQSVCAALEMARGLKLVNERLTAKGYPPIDVGIGINTGDVVLGSIGSERKLDYTIIGDHVNLGSRLEGLTKQYGCRIIISEFTYDELHGEIPCLVVDVVRVKGKQVPIRIYSPLALPNDSPDDISHARTVAELSERAFCAYHARKFDEAEALYRQLPEGRLRDLYIERCEAYRAQPPPTDWDGVYNLTTK